MMETDDPDSVRRVDRDDREAFLHLLEGRRLALDGSMWQAPTLTGDSHFILP